MKPWDVIVVGAGVTGLSLARMLHDDGVSVLLLDKSHRPGGRLSTKTVGGLHLDPGPKKCGAKMRTFNVFSLAGMV